jgi:hypothetical protein
LIADRGLEYCLLLVYNRAFEYRYSGVNNLINWEVRNEEGRCRHRWR